MRVVEEKGEYAPYRIEEWPMGSGPPRLVVAALHLPALRAAWDAVQGDFPGSELTVRQGCRVLNRRGPVGGL